MPSRSVKRPEILPLTSLRFLAASWVVAYHYLTPALRASAWAPAWLVDLCAAGFVGVPVFFVLSGFVLMYTYEATDFRVQGAKRAFWAARFARIYPLYIVAFLLAFPPALVALWTHQPGLASPQEHAWGAVLSPLLLQSWGGDAYKAWNTPGWTLSVEAAFYVAFPFVARRARHLGRWVVGTAALSAALLAWHIAGGPLAPSTAFATRNPVIHVPAFFAGMWLARHRGAVATWSAARLDAAAIASAAGFLAVVLLLFGPGGPAPGQRNPLLNSILLVPFVALLVLALSAQRGRVARALSPAWFVRLGTISYGVYILQDPVAKYVLYAPGFLFGVELAGTFVGFALLSAVLLLASEVAYRAIERPWQRRLRAWLAPKPKDAAAQPSPDKAPEPTAA